MTDVKETPPLHGKGNVTPNKTARNENRPRKKDLAYYAEQRAKYEDSFKGNEFLTISESLDAVNTRTNSLLTTNMKSRQLIGVQLGKHGRGSQRCLPGV